MLIKLLSVVALGASAVFGSATPTLTTRDLDTNPPTSVLEASYHPIPQVSARSLTNAKRLASGLSLKPPLRRSHIGLARSTPSGTPVAYTQGFIEVKDEGGHSLGFVSATQNSFGEWGDTSDLTKRLLVSIDLEDAKTGTADIQTVNGPDVDLPFFGGMKGYAATSADINVGSLNYIYLGGTTQTPPNSPPVDGSNSFTKATGIAEKIESAIFAYNEVTSIISLQWINSDLSSPATYLAYVPSSSGYILTGDLAVFTSNFGAVVSVTFTFVPA